jgi:hypothetical protein
VPDVYATIADADPALVARIAEDLELRAADPLPGRRPRPRPARQPDLRRGRRPGPGLPRSLLRRGGVPHHPVPRPRPRGRPGRVGRIGEATAAALKAEAHERIAAGRFFGHIAYASLVARLPD